MRDALDVARPGAQVQRAFAAGRNHRKSCAAGASTSSENTSTAPPPATSPLIPCIPGGPGRVGTGSTAARLLLLVASQRDQLLALEAKLAVPSTLLDAVHEQDHRIE